MVRKSGRFFGRSLVGRIRPRAWQPFWLWALLLLWLILGWRPLTAHAEEGGGGHYQPGTLASAIDMLPLVTPVTAPRASPFSVRLDSFGYDGNIAKPEQAVPVGGMLATRLDIDMKVLALNLMWNPGREFGDGWAYALGLSLPYVSLDVSANVEDDPVSGRTGFRHDSEDGIGDVLLLPVMLSTSLADDWYSEWRLGIYAPTGRYEVGRLANPGRNYWTFSPSASVVYLQPMTGQEFVVSAGIDVNTENAETHYRSGVQGHLESTLIQHVMLLGGFTGIGLTGYWYRQLSADSGDGARFGDFKGMAAGVGPVLTYRKQFANSEIVSELKWLNEFTTRRRPEGNTFAWKLRVNF